MGEGPSYDLSLFCMLYLTLLSAWGSIVLKLLCNPIELRRSIAGLTYAQGANLIQ
jgi:hypothetical protein